MRKEECVICNEPRDNDYGTETSIGFVCFDDECIIDSRTRIDTRISALEALLKEAGEALESGQVLVLKMFEVYGDPQYQAAFSLLADHQGAYTGKKWTKEQDDFSAKSAEVSKKIQKTLGGEA